MTPRDSSAAVAPVLSEPFGTLLIVGLGLLGGSAALAARQTGCTERIIALNRPGSPHDEARDAGLIDDYTEHLDRAVAAADLVLLCQPVNSIRAILPAVLAAARPGTLVTDVGSTKGTLVETAETIPSQAHFVGSHPMAGSHLTGWRSARADLFSGATTYVTPTSATNLAAVARTAAFWRALGSRVIITDPRRHDRLVALLSHVPHMTAAALVQHLANSGEDPELLRLLAGNGLRDTTRIAQGSPLVWKEICQHNAQEISTQLRDVASLLERMASQLEAATFDELEATLALAAELRGRLG
jgi:prephenate dehydrogenase